MFRTIADIDREEPAYKRIRIKPQPGGKCTWASGRYESIYGEIIRDWKITGHRFNMNLTIPANTTAIVYIPADDPKKVREGNQPATQAQGVRFMKTEGRWAVFETGSGTCQFVAQQ